MVVELRGVRSGDLSLLSSVPGRPRGAKAEKAGTWLKAFATASEWRAVALTYMYGGLRVLGLGHFAWLTGALGLQETQGLNQAIGFVRAFGVIWIGMGDEDGTRASLR